MVHIAALWCTRPALTIEVVLKGASVHTHRTNFIPSTTEAGGRKYLLYLICFYVAVKGFTPQT